LDHPPFSILCGSSVGASLRRRRSCRGAVSPFSILCGSSVGASPRGDGHQHPDHRLSVSSADRAWVQEVVDSGNVHHGVLFQYPLRIERGCKGKRKLTAPRDVSTFSILCGSSVGASHLALPLRYCGCPFSILCGSSVGARKPCLPASAAG